MSDQVAVDPRRRASAAAVDAVPVPTSASDESITTSIEAPPPAVAVDPPTGEESEASQEPELVSGVPVEPAPTTLTPSSSTVDVPPAASSSTPEALSEEQVASMPTLSVSDSAAMEAAIAATLALVGGGDGGDEAEDSMDIERASAEPEALPAPSSIAIKIEPVETDSVPPSPRKEDPLSRISTPTLLETGKQAALAFAARTKASAPVSRVAQLNSRIEKDPLDSEARLALISDAVQKGDLERIRETYEDFFKVFPDAAQQWIAYAKLELSHSLFPRVEAIFARCLRPSPSVELWKFYLDYIRRINPIDLTQAESAKEARAIIAKSFEFALSHVGQDRRAGEIWLEYITFLKEGQNRGTWEDQQRMDALRKAFTRAVCLPINNVELIWQEYNTFENNLNKMTAKKFVAELSPSYMTARKALREMRAQFDHLAVPDLPHRPDWYSSAHDRDSLALWRKYLLWEESNPLDIEDQSALQARVSFAYKRALVFLRFFSEAWYLAANYNTRMGKVEEGRQLLQAGLAANPSSVLLAYTLAELEEGAGDTAACYKIYEGLIESFHSRLAGLEAATEKEVAEAVQSMEADADPQEDEKPQMTNGDEEEEKGGRTVQEKEERKSEIRARRQPEIDSVKRSAANVWVTMMRFARRAEGVKQARNIFTRSRKSPSLVWQVIEASASMELFWNNDVNIATKVYELGLKTFAQEPDYILHYLDFLIRSNNPNNARALFERSIAVIEPTKAKPIWERMAQYEYQYGDYLAAQKIFQRYVDAFPDASPIDRFAKRHGYLDLDDAFIEDLGPATISLPTRRRRRSSSSSSSSPLRPPIINNHNKRGHSTEPEGGGSGPPMFERATYDGSGTKRMKQFHPEGSPAPSSQGGGGGGDRDYPRGSIGGGGGGGGGGGRGRWDDHDRERDGGYQNRGGGGGGGGNGGDRDRGGPTPPSRGSSGPARPPAPPRPVPFALTSRGDEVAVLPEAVVFFLSILPSPNSFKGPFVPPLGIVDIIRDTILPGSAPGPGLPGERLGIPPRQKSMGAGGNDGGWSPMYQGGGGGDRDRDRERDRDSRGSRGNSPPPMGRRGGGGGRGEPDYGYGDRDRERDRGDRRGNGGGGGGGGGRRY